MGEREWQVRWRQHAFGEKRLEAKHNMRSGSQRERRRHVERREEMLENEGRRDGMERLRVLHYSMYTHCT